MNKAELVNDMATRSGLLKRDVEKALDAFTDVVSTALEGGDKVQMVGFGSFEVRTRAARKGKNPQTGETIDIPEAKVPVFKPGKGLKEMLEK